ncbi:hypothetical protein AKJ09_01233 [Labilithrix luteola]|uniref:Uncharacterized protein n=1 Tax=Labilithrix luteola TaxID=1391654 RepID=A0A0K1PN80_9BACT|nr:hypothetical protein AKJ09_01233 [Labilithrix luteola]
MEAIVMNFPLSGQRFAKECQLALPCWRNEPIREILVGDE